MLFFNILSCFNGAYIGTKYSNPFLRRSASHEFSYYQNKITFFSLFCPEKLIVVRSSNDSNRFCKLNTHTNEEGEPTNCREATRMLMRMYLLRNLLYRIPSRTKMYFMYLLT